VLELIQSERTGDSSSRAARAMDDGRDDRPRIITSQTDRDGLFVARRCICHRVIASHAQSRPFVVAVLISK